MAFRGEAADVWHHNKLGFQQERTIRVLGLETTSLDWELKESAGDNNIPIQVVCWFAWLCYNDNTKWETLPAHGGDLLVQIL